MGIVCSIFHCWIFHNISVSSYTILFPTEGKLKSIITVSFDFLWKLQNYSLFQCIFFIWCMLPIENNGSVLVYHKIIRPYFLKHQSGNYKWKSIIQKNKNVFFFSFIVADDVIEKLAGKAKEVVSDVFKKDK